MDQKAQSEKMPLPTAQLLQVHQAPSAELNGQENALSNPSVKGSPLAAKHNSAQPLEDRLQPHAMAPPIPYGQDNPIHQPQPQPGPPAPNKQPPRADEEVGELERKEGGEIVKDEGAPNFPAEGEPKVARAPSHKGQRVMPRREDLPFAPRSNFRTSILADAVFEVEKRFEVKQIIGHGAYGIVCSGRDVRRNSDVALKKIENIFEHRSLARRTLRELKFCRLFQHENIMSVNRVMLPCTPSFENIYMTTDLMETDLACVIRSPQSLSDEHVQFFIYQVVRGLHYIHSANVMHRDMKPRNLLVNSNCDLKICDFGLARLDDPAVNGRVQMSSYIATRWYRAPEVILGTGHYTKAVDMWSVGCILAELIGRKPIFPGRDSFHQLTLIVSILGTPKTDDAKALPDFVRKLPKRDKIPFSKVYPAANPLAWDLLDSLLEFDPENRMTVEEALAHPYLADLHSPEDEPVFEDFPLTEFAFEGMKMSIDDLRDLIHGEIADHYDESHWAASDEPEEDDDDNNKGMFSAFAAALRRRLPGKGGGHRRHRSL